MSHIIHDGKHLADLFVALIDLNSEHPLTVPDKTGVK